MSRTGSTPPPSRRTGSGGAAEIEATIPLSPTQRPLQLPTSPAVHPGVGVVTSSYHVPAYSSYADPMNRNPNWTPSRGSAVLGSSQSSSVVAESLHIVREAQREADIRGEEIGRLQNARDMIAQDNRSLQAQLAQMTREHAAVLKELTDLQKKVEREETLRVQSIYQSQEDRERDEATIFQLRHAVEQLKRENETLRSTVKRATDEASVKEEARRMDDAALSNCMLENEQLKRTLAKKDDTVKKADALAAQRAKELASITVNRVKLEQQLGRATAQVNGLKAQMDKQLAEREAVERSLLLKLQSAAEALQEVKDECSIKESRLISLEREARGALDVQEELRMRLTDAEAEISSLNARVAEADARYAGAVDERDQRVKELTALTDAKVQELTALLQEQSVANATRKVQERNALDTQNEKLIAAQVEVHTLQSQLQAAEEKTVEVRGEMALQEKRLQLLQSSLDQKTQAMEQLRGQFKELQEKYFSQSIGGGETERLLNQSRSEAGLLKKELDAVTDRYHAATGANMRLESDIQLLGDRLNQAEGRCEELKKLLSESEQKVVKLTTEVQRLVSTLTEEQKQRWNKDAQLESSERSLSTVKALHEERIRTLESERDAMRQSREIELGNMKLRHTEELKILSEKHQSALAAAERATEVVKGELRALSNQMSLERDAAAAKHNAAINAVREECAMEKRTLEVAHRQEVQAELEALRTKLEERRQADLKFQEDRFNQERNDMAAMHERQGKFGEQAAAKDLEAVSAKLVRTEGLLQRSEHERQELKVQYDELNAQLKKERDEYATKTSEWVKQEMAMSRTQRDRDELTGKVQQLQQLLQAEKATAKEHLIVSQKLESTIRQTEAKVEHLEELVRALRDEVKDEREANQQKGSELSKLAHLLRKAESERDDAKADLVEARDALRQQREELTGKVGDGIKLENIIRKLEHEKEELQTKLQTLREQSRHEKMDQQRKIDDLVQKEESNAFTIGTRGKLIQAVWEMYGRTVTARKHLKSTFQHPTWRAAVERQHISDEVGDGLCLVVEDVQWLHDRGHWIISNFFTEIEQKHLGTSPSFFQSPATTTSLLPYVSPTRGRASSPHHQQQSHSHSAAKKGAVGSTEHSALDDHHAGGRAADESVSPRPARFTPWPGQQTREASPTRRL